MDADYGNVSYRRQSKQPSQCVMACFGLLGVLLLLANMGHIIYHATLVQGSCECSTLQLAELQANYVNFTSQSQDLVQQVRELVKEAEKDRGRPCETGWKKFGANCYIVTTEKKNWTSSRRDCLVRGADLVTITSPQEQIFVNSLLAKNVETWIGMIDILEEGVWMWVDGTHVTKTYWAQGQPDNYKNWDQDCVEFWPNNQYGSWNDEECTVRNIFICEKTL